MTPDRSPAAFRLNPFAFTAETDMRFLLLLLAAAGTTFGLADFTVYVLVPYFLADRTYDTLVSAISAIAIVALMFWLAHRRAHQAAQRQIASGQWVAFPPQSRDTLEQASPERMRAHVDQLVAQLPDVAAQQPRFYWNATSIDSQHQVGMAFGYRQQPYVSLNEGLHAAFLSAPRSERFQAVLLHELGHIANRDISRTTFSIELGRTFTQVTLVLAALTEGYLLFHLFRRLLSGKAEATDIQGIGIMVQTAIGAALVIALIDILRAGILRAREYYADARAHQWLGKSTPLVDLFRRHTEQAPAPLAAAPALGLVHQAPGSQQPLWDQIRKHIAPLHPSADQRIETLKHPRNLFAIDLWITFVAGLLSGLALNANSLVLAALLRLGSTVNTLLSNSLNTQLSRGSEQAIFFLSLLASVLIAALAIGMFIVFFTAPLVGTVGVMVQRAVFADHSVYSAGAPLLPLHRLALVALLVGLGIVLGGTLTPASGVLTLQSRDWLLAPVFVLMWAAIVFIWLLPLRWCARVAYRSHVGAKPAVFRRRSIAVLATLAITPSFLFMMFGQGAATGVDTTSITAEMKDVLLFGWLLSLPVSLIIWGIGAVLMWLAGWFGPARCAACDTMARHTTATTLHCANCGQALKPWAIVPAAITFPPLPPRPYVLPSDTPPPL
jgi:Zn-dependent protease with chaperone function